MAGLLVCDAVLCFCHFSIRCLGSLWYLIVSIPDLCLLPHITLILSQPLLAGVISCGIHGIYTCTRLLALTVYPEALAFD